MRNPKREIQDIERFEEILGVLAKNGFKDIVTRLKLQEHLSLTEKIANPEPTPQRFRETVEELGVVFIKFGQMLAERKDFIPERYAEELKKLENDVKPFDPEEAKEIVDEEVGLDKFEQFSEEPIASASIAQVHSAELENGDKAAVKVRRPGIRKRVKTDLDIVSFLARKYDNHYNPEHDQVRRDVEEFARWTDKELDLKNEAKNAKRLRENLKDEEKVRIPEVYEDLTTEKVLTTEYIDAVRVDDIEGLEEREIKFEDVARIGVRCELKQILRDGFFHADPHPSNFLVDTEGNLVYLDFGIMGRLTPKKRRLVGLMFYYMVEQDVEGLMSVLEEVGYEEDSYDREELKHEVERTILDIKQSTLEQSSFTKSFAKIALKASSNGLYISNDLIMMGKGMATMEGIGIDVYPEYRFEEENYSDLQDILKQQFNVKDAAEEFAVDLLRNRDELTKLPSSLLESEEGGDRKIEIKNEASSDNVFPASLIIGSTILFYQTLPERYMLPIALLEFLAAVHFLE